ncbi:hypothetical protein Bca4012_004951 [Brassica carinata]|uniref:BnaC03g45090D protein n=3 Tax=Brassica TaxID=3705 RepID=A0A078ILY7_BRANA|nr:hypothetical protein F2Q69_00004380 [Brassica cretica]CDY50409.1 BnaC03g45090D [Brassica napus]
MAAANAFLASNRMQSLPGPPWRRKLQLIVWQAVIYSIWQERNALTSPQHCKNHYYHLFHTGQNDSK